jgi:hypothetical protein
MGRRLWSALAALSVMTAGSVTASADGPSSATASGAPADAAGAPVVAAPMQGGRPGPDGIAPRLAGAPGTLTSTNWSGYAESGAFTDVQGTWVQPTVTCPVKRHQFSSFWVGLDGLNDGTVEQLGTDSDCRGKNRPSYYAWYEMYPGPSAVLPTGHAVTPGDTMQAEVSFTKGATKPFTLSITDMGKWTFSISEATSGSPQRSSAEWIAEAPSRCGITCTVLPLADFNTVSFTNASANGAAISAGTDVAITMKRGTTTKATPAALSAGGTAFDVTWHHS